MHSALAVPELCTLICNALTNATYGKERSASLLSLSLVSHLWNEIALPVLWEELHDMTPLLCLLPGDAWKIENGKKGNSKEQKFVLRRKLRRADWASFRKYAIFVKSLVLKPEVSPRDQRRIAQCWLPGVPTLPRLRKLRIHIRKELRVDFLSLFFSASTTALTVSDIGFWPAVHWQDLLSSCPNLSTVTMSRWSDTAAGIYLYAELARALRSESHALTSVRVALNIPYSGELIRALASCPALERLHLELIEEEANDDPISAANIPYPSFQSLRELTLNTIPMALLRTVIISGPKLRLTEIYASTRHLYTQDDLVQTMAAIAENCNRSALSSLTLDCNTDAIVVQNGRTDRRVVLRKDVLAPIAAFSGLSHLYIEGITDVEIDDAEWEAIAHWWPELELFNVQGFTNTYCPITAILPCSQACPRLKSLSLPVDATILQEVCEDGPPLQVDACASPPRLTLDVGFSRIRESDPVNTARWLVQTIPGLKDVEFDGTGLAYERVDLETLDWEVYRERHNAWILVRDLVKAKIHGCAPPENYYLDDDEDKESCDSA
ncbi:hypothetical protein GGF50DRAFT_91196 [Schizophyllum commune]